MILDKVLHGVLDQGRGCLLIFNEPGIDVSNVYLSVGHLIHIMHPIPQNSYGAAIQTLEQIGKVVDSLYAKVRS